MFVNGVRMYGVVVVVWDLQALAQQREWPALLHATRNRKEPNAS